LSTTGEPDGPPNAVASDINSLRLSKSHGVEMVIPLPVS
jgi:hypothetical protein